LDGINIKEYDYWQYTALFSVVFQDFYLFPLQLGANVASGKEYDKGRADACLSSAGFSERMRTMTDGLDTMLYQTYDDNGIQVSGGEAQKIALARALYKDAPFVILDEPTAALDPIAEYEVYSAFEQTIGGKTAVFISHRLSSCRFCHDIAVFDGGQMIQKGGHETLLADESGMYRKLWYAQAQYYVDQKE
jgi:ATP-binding cassette subfamily B protein